MQYILLFLLTFDVLLMVTCPLFHWTVSMFLSDLLVSVYQDYLSFGERELEKQFKTCSFLISFFKSASYFSFWLAFAAECTYDDNVIA